MSAVQSSCDSIACLIGGLVRTVTGTCLLLIGSSMVITLWLLPFGLVVGLLGLALLVSEGGSTAITEGTAGYRQPGPAVLPSANTIERLKTYVDKYRRKTGTSLHPDASVTEAVIVGLAENAEQVGRPLCPCNFYPDKRAELAAGRDWVCACDEMKQYKYCQCLLFVTPQGLPITEYLPEGHAGREIYGLVNDPAPHRGRESKHHVVDWREKPPAGNECPRANERGWN